MDGFRFGSWFPRRALIACVALVCLVAAHGASLLHAVAHDGLVPHAGFAPAAAPASTRASPAPVQPRPADRATGNVDHDEGDPVCRILLGIATGAPMGAGIAPTVAPASADRTAARPVSVVRAAHGRAGSQQARAPPASPRCA